MDERKSLKGLMLVLFAVSIVLITVSGVTAYPSAIVRSCNIDGELTEEFGPGEIVYACGKGYEPFETVTIYVVPNNYPCREESSLCSADAEADASGRLDSTPLCTACVELPVGEYDIWVDRDGSGSMSYTFEPVWYWCARGGFIVTQPCQVTFLTDPVCSCTTLPTPTVDGYASGANPLVDTVARMTDEGWEMVTNDTIAHDHDFSITDDAPCDFWMSVWKACDDADNVYLAFLSNYQLYGVRMWLDFNGDGVFTLGTDASPLFVCPGTPGFPCVYNYTVGVGFTDPIAGASVAYGFDNRFIELMVPKVEIESSSEETVWDCMDWNYMLGVDANANFMWDGLNPDWMVTGWNSWCTFTDNREHEMWDDTQWVPLELWFACPCELPVCCCYSICFEGTVYHDGEVGTFAYGTSGLATASCCTGWVFDHWEVTGNVAVSDPDANPTTVTVCCGGSLKAIFEQKQCEVTFYTDPVCSLYNITFQCHTYHDGDVGTFAYGTSGLATAHCSAGWVFDHWEVTGNVAVSSTTDNPTTVTICCGGSLKAVCVPIICEVTFLTDPVCCCYSICFEGTVYHDGDVGTFAYGTCGLATASCCTGWVFDHWEVTGNVAVSDPDANPATVTVTCGGSLKAVCSPKQCEVTFYTDPAGPDFYITFRGQDYHDGVTDTFDYDSFGLPTGHCPDGWELDHWEATGNIHLSCTTQNPTNMIICCGGTLRAVFREATGNPATLFTRTPSEPYADQKVIFNASSSHDPDGLIISYTWDFGDGNTTIISDPVIIHCYASIGTYNVTLTVTDNDGLKDSAKNHLTVRTLAGDLNGDLIVNILDVAVVAKDFGFDLQDLDWNAMVDLDNNGIINIVDIAIVAKEYGKTAQ